MILTVAVCLTARAANTLFYLVMRRDLWLIFPCVSAKRDVGFLLHMQILKEVLEERGNPSFPRQCSWLEAGCGDAKVCWLPLKQSPGLCQCFAGRWTEGNLPSERAKMPFEQVKLLSCEKSFCGKQSLGIPPWDISAGSQELALWMCWWQPGCPQILHCCGHQGCPCRLARTCWDVSCPERGGCSEMH